MSNARAKGAPTRLGSWPLGAERWSTGVYGVVESCDFSYLAKSRTRTKLGSVEWLKMANWSGA
jgi:hypothetical protein